MNAGSGDFTREIVNAIEQWLGNPKTGYDYVKIGRIMAAMDTANFVRESMPLAPIYSRKGLLHQAALKESNPDGLFLEFGVASGSSINFLAEQIGDRLIHGFDSFEGLPESWTSKFQKGHFAQPVPEVRENVRLHVGWFDASLPDFLKETPGHVSFLHVDCDLYSSTKTIFDLLGDRITEGSVIVFDEYFNYPTWRDHEHKAFMEFVEKRKLSFDYIGAVHSSKQVAVKIGRAAA
jgi:predicted O-methyltransferase YrrM